jgi:hypothetical protein
LFCLLFCVELDYGLMVMGGLKEGVIIWWCGMCCLCVSCCDGDGSRSLWFVVVLLMVWRLIVV